MVWILPTRKRPELCQEVLDACENCGMTSAGILWVDAEGAESYENLRIPRNWVLHVERADLQAAKQQVFLWFPNEMQYGLILDDTIPETPEFDKKMEEAAGNWFLLDTEDKWMAQANKGNVNNLLGAYCWGGELVRSIGTLVLPGGHLTRAQEDMSFGPHRIKKGELYLAPIREIGAKQPQRQAGNDNAWSEDVGREIGIRKRTYDVVFDHRNWRTGRRPKDETDSWERAGYNYIQADFQLLELWRNAGAPGVVRKHIVEARQAAEAIE